MQIRLPLAVLVPLTIAACDAHPAPTTTGAPLPATAAPSVIASSAPPTGTAPTPPTARAVPLPGATGPASLDYIAYESPAHGHSRVWVPVGATGSVDVFDIASGAFTRVDGFTTAEREMHGKKRIQGPSAVAIGDGFAYVGDRATNEVCPVDLKTLTRGPCLKLGTGIDGVSYVARTKEVWVTTPSEQTLTLLSTEASGALKVAGTIKVGGQPEGYAVDESHGLFFTNLEDKGGTVVIDVEKRAVTATWSPACGEDGPRGVAVDEAQRVVLVACTDHIQALDAAANGTLLAKLDTGAGVDNIDFASASRRLYIAAGKAARMTVAQVGEHGALAVITVVNTRDGARNAVADAQGNVYVADSAGANLLLVSLAPGATR